MTYVSKLQLIIKHCDTVLADNEEKLDLSLRETADLVQKLDKEKKQREVDLNYSFTAQDLENNSDLKGK